jgi:hypothetical protein
MVGRHSLGVKWRTALKIRRDADAEVEKWRHMGFMGLIFCIYCAGVFPDIIREVGICLILCVWEYTQCMGLMCALAMPQTVSGSCRISPWIVPLSAHL